MTILFGVGAMVVMAVKARRRWLVLLAHLAVLFYFLHGCGFAGLTVT
jgi:hypothetical protein